MEALGINIGYLIMQILGFGILIGVPILVIIRLRDRYRNVAVGGETIDVIKVSDQGVVIPHDLVKGADRVVVKRKQRVLILVLETT